MDLAVIREIEQLKYRYLRSLDLKLWDDFAQTLTEDVDATYGERLQFSGRDRVVGYMRESLPGSIITLHQCHHPEIAVDGDTATGTWYLEDKVLVTEHRLMLTGASFYTDDYRRGERGWQIAKTRYIRTFEAMESLPESWNLLASRWATTPAG
ncbi:nuclear transport factor 2 family protein [Jatrophihabitans sp.]|uniref:nuclear transport factor 2 family protein n=1 Tax=Jatrophihabitans sp. TaxID=1932789 RepID=UPI0030C69A81|nr:putative dehydratase [Jatrophihabitans sp.]